MPRKHGANASWKKFFCGVSRENNWIFGGHEDSLFFGKVSMHMKLGFYVGMFSARTCIQIIPDLQFFVLWACFWCHPPKKKTTDKNQVHFVT